MAEHSGPSPTSKPKPLAILILLIAAAYFCVEFGSGYFTKLHAPHGKEAPVSDEADHAHDVSSTADRGEPSHEIEATQHAADAGHRAQVPSPLAVTPFVCLLLAIAVMPLIQWTQHWWESNLNRFIVALICSAATLAYYLLLKEGGGISATQHVLEHAILGEYIPFIVLLFSLYVISGGIRIEGDLTATPKTNSIFLLAGGGLASFVGTTGAAMLLIRPLIDTNDERKHLQHTIVFFIFIVCNCGGCLLPIGDPPLFLGYLLGVEFLWTLWNLWLPWLLVNAVLVTIYYVVDRFIYFPKEAITDIYRDAQDTRPLQIDGLLPNALLLLGVIFSIALLDPQKPFLGTGWYPWPFLREVVQLLLVAISLWYTEDRVRIANRFNYHAILEVAALFVGIFICMQPAIEILHEKGSNLGLDTPTKLFWVTGGLSAVLDNAPTYVVFFETAAADPKFVGESFSELVSGDGPLARLACHLLVGVSLGAVFLGAMTYIGNGPNFMVRAIAEESGIKMPSFFGYVLRYSLPILVPVFWLVTTLILP